MRPLTGILLAAGASRRFGSKKLLAPLADGTPLAVAAARALVAAVPSTLAVVASGDRFLAALLAAEGLRIVECADAEQGMGRSFAAGVSASADAAGWLIALADMPYIKESTIAGLAAELAAGAMLVAPVYQGRRGHPVGFDSMYRAELLALSGDRGARDILERSATRLTQVAVDDPGVLYDVDRPEDLRPSAALDDASVTNRPV